MSDLDRLVRRIGAIAPRGRRALVAIAGPPGSGKSTLAGQLVQALGGGAALVPMDGFHLDDRVLRQRGLLARKGAPETFDAAGFLAAVRRLGVEDEVVVPVFDRTREIAIAGAQVVGPQTRVAVVEGNYLLLDEPPWRALRAEWDLSVFLDVAMEELERRLLRRWRNHDHAPEAAAARVGSNDLPNARHVVQASAGADIVLRQAPD